MIETSTEANSCRLTEKDIVGAMWTHLRPRVWIRLLGFLVGALALFALVHSALALKTTGRHTSFWLLASAFLYFGFVFMFWYPYRARRLYRQASSANAPFTISFDDSGLRLASESVSAQIPWNNIRKWKESSATFLLYQNDALYQVLPKRFFPPEDLGRLRALLVQHVRRVA